MRELGRIAGLISTTLTLVGCGEECKIPQKPNILFIIAEDMSLDLECYGCKGVQTPNINRLAENGVMYTNARCCSSISSPTRSAMMTGLHQTVSGSHNHRSNRDVPLPAGILPVTSYLRDAGYTCVLGNKSCYENKNIAYNDVQSSRKIDCNFRWDMVGEYDGVENFGLFDKLHEVNPDDVPFFCQISLYITHRGDHWNRIRRASDDPVNPAEVEVPPYMPDHPTVRHDIATLLDQVEYMDGEVGMILDEFERKGLMENTIVFFVADNGRCDVRAKSYLYEPGTRVPLIVSGKGIKPAVVEQLVSELDLPASFLHLAGVEQPDYYQGRVLNALLPEGEQQKPYDYLYTAADNFDDIIECFRAVHDNRYTYIRNHLPQYPYDRAQMYMDLHRPSLHIMRQLKAKGELDENQPLFMAPTKPVEELYDYTTDPHCIHNLALDPNYAEDLERMRGYMADWQAKNGDKGLDDLHSRTLSDGYKEENRLRHYLKTKQPKVWEDICSGIIFDEYDHYKEMMKKEQQNNKTL